MIKKIIKNVYIFFPILFIFFTLKVYFSDTNIKKIINSKSSMTHKLNDLSKNLPVLKNDTQNVIEYSDNVNEIKKKEKRKFWDLIKN